MPRRAHRLCAPCSSAAPPPRPRLPLFRRFAEQTARHAERFGITSFVYSRRRPFHPQRLVERCIQQLPAKQNLALKEQLQALPKDAKSPFAALVRSKGFLWLSNNHLEAFYWAHAGNYFEVKKQGLWWAAIERKDWPAEDAADIEAEVVPVFGDRRQELVFIGIGLDERALTAELDLCLLSDAEMETYKCAASAPTRHAQPPRPWMVPPPGSSRCARPLPSPR